MMANQQQKVALVFVCTALFMIVGVLGQDVKVDIVNSFPGNSPVSGSHSYDAHVTLSIENSDGSLTPSGWSTRKENGGTGKPFTFTPGVGLIQGWTEGVLKMKEGERGILHVPPSKGYGGQDMGRKGGGWYIPANSNLHFDIEIFGKHGQHKDL